MRGNSSLRKRRCDGTGQGRTKTGRFGSYAQKRDRNATSARPVVPAGFPAVSAAVSSASCTRTKYRAGPRLRPAPGETRGSAAASRGDAAVPPNNANGMRATKTTGSWSLSKLNGRGSRVRAPLPHTNAVLKPPVSTFGVCPLNVESSFVPLELRTRTEV